MGTRGFIGFVADGAQKIAYNHWDSYPSGKGLDVLEWLRGVVSESEGLHRELTKALSAVPDRDPTDVEREQLVEFEDASVGGPDEHWYKLLRGAQGDPDRILRAGYYEDASDFPQDSLWCEWGYLVNFDTRKLEVYQGFRHSPATEGRWADPLGKPNDAGYYPVQRAAWFSFDALPTDEDFVTLLEPDD